MALHFYKQGDVSDNLVDKQRNVYPGSEFLDSRWSGVGTHMGDHELEEGEACDEPDFSCDPDTEFSYLDEKIVTVLGDVQRCFEGGVSTEKLGSKFGAYGSFLPTQERPPSILHQEKPSSGIATDAYYRTKKSSDEGVVEQIKRNATSSFVRASASKGGLNSNTSTHENGVRDPGLANERAGNVDCSSVKGRLEENQGVPRKVKLKIKMGSETSEKKKNATIYSDFGLGNSSSEPEDEFGDDDHRTDSDQISSPDRTPLTIIKIMTSHHIPDGKLLSPLPDLVIEPSLQKERISSTCQESINEKAKSPFLQKHNLSKTGDSLEKVDVSKERAREHTADRKGDSATSSDRAPKRVKVEKERGSSKDNSKHASKPSSKAYGKDMLKANEVERIVRDAVSESETGVKSNDSHRDYKGFSLERAPFDYPKDFCSPFQPPKEVDSGRELQLRGCRIEKGASSSHDSMNEQLDGGHQGQDIIKDGYNTLEANLHGKRHLDVSSELSDRKRSSGKGFITSSEGKSSSGQSRRVSTSKGGGTGKISAPSSDIPGKEISDSKKRLLEQGQETDGSRISLREKVKHSHKDSQRSTMKDKHLKTSSASDLVVNGTPKDGLQYSSKAACHKDYKDSQQLDLPKAHKTENTEPKRKEKIKEKFTSDHINSEPPRVPDQRHKETATKEMPAKVAQPAEAITGDKSHQEVPSSAPSAPNGAPYNLVIDSWVGCDKCEKWRLLPPGLGTENLPKKWSCRMLYWLEKENLNNCSYPEEVTDEATRRIFNMPTPLPTHVQENPPAVQSIEPAIPVASSSLPLSNATINQEPKAPEKHRAPSISNKKRKIPTTASGDHSLPSRKINHVEAPPAVHDSNLTKLGEDTSTTQERVQIKSGTTDLGSGKAEEKQKVKEKEKTRRHRPSDAGSGLSPSGKKHSQSAGNLLLREATKLKHKANDMQGQELAKIALYLQAALKFLQAASLLESEGAGHGDNRHGTIPFKIYADTAKLCEYCACTYERTKDHAPAALAYKCAGVAWMRVVQAKNSLVKGCRNDVLSAQEVPGESPHLAPADAVSNKKLLQGAYSPTSIPHSGGSLIISGKTRVSLNEVLDYVQDTNSAVDALTKSLHAFTAAESALACAEHGMTALKRVVDFSFHDVDFFVRLVRLALEAMGH
ncbi:hypothetical protein KP509_34G045900 [Ceratopteris richardii]|uniref:CW-type domain-containing protein n=3 Tax=Ceratopteris richardii TaxID=49495 RepID=A0A8T2QJE9_CERRI|nr:hypothetical protein KP509_34G045900 [Ceratopteris richardii]